MANPLHRTHSASDPIAAELHAYNSAFSELELPWRWDADTFRQLLGVAGGRDPVTAYIESSQQHLLRAYDKTFLRDLVFAVKARHRGDLAS